MLVSTASRRRLAACSGVLVFAGIAIGLVPVTGSYDSEGFHCGLPLAFGAPLQHETGYEGTPEWSSCTAKRNGLTGLSTAILGAGLVAGVVARSSRRKSYDLT